jgi:2-polyprenyl-3-methyl-5-hydroxy-6-metoxy-1,4-benzoquinol methylase
MSSILNSAERAGNYTDVNNYVMARHIIAYNTVKNVIGKKVLELGCGTGYGMRQLAPLVDTYIGLDKFTNPNAEVPQNAAVFTADFPNLQNIASNSFDSIICFQVIEHIQDDVKLVTEAARILKPGGKLYLTTPNILTTLTRNPYHIREYTPTQMANTIAKGFTNFTVKGVYGNQKVMAYYNANKASVQKILKWDVLKLEKNLPAALIKIPYNVMNNFNRKKLYNSSTDLTASITADDFFIDTVNDACLDYFVIAEK